MALSLVARRHLEMNDSMILSHDRRVYHGVRGTQNRISQRMLAHVSRLTTMSGLPERGHNVFRRGRAGVGLVRRNGRCALAGTEPLDFQGDLAERMVDGLHRYLDRATAASVAQWKAHYQRDFSSAEAYDKSVAANRARLKEILGVVEARVPVVNGKRSFSRDMNLARCVQLWEMPVTEGTNSTLASYAGPVSWHRV